MVQVKFRQGWACGSGLGAWAEGQAAWQQVVSEATATAPQQQKQQPKDHGGLWSHFGSSHVFACVFRLALCEVWLVCLDLCSFNFASSQVWLVCFDLRCAHFGFKLAWPPPGASGSQNHFKTYLVTTQVIITFIIANPSGARRPNHGPRTLALNP